MNFIRGPWRNNGLKPVFGWWSLDPEGPTLVNSASGQRVRYIGPIDLTDSAFGGPWHRFDYEDPEVRYPVLAQVETKEFRTEVRSTPSRTPILTVDHDLSAALWRSETNAADETVPYGLWRRVDDCLTDAFPCWPGCPPGEASPRDLFVRGGWLNSLWQSNFQRSFRSFWALPEETRRGWAERPLYAEKPFVMPLETETPSPWRFQELPQLDDYSAFYGNEISHRKQERYFGPAGSHCEKVPISCTPPTKAGAVFMWSEDRERILFIAAAFTNRGYSGHSGPEQFLLQYSDKDIEARFNGRNLSLDHPTNWSFDFHLGYGARHKNSSDPDMFYTVDDGRYSPAMRKICIPSHALWRRLVWAIFDSWFYFDGVEPPSNLESDVLALYPAFDFEIKPNYLGGKWGAGGPCTASLNDDEQ